MDLEQVQATARALEEELNVLELKRARLVTALRSLRSLIPGAQMDDGGDGGDDSLKFPGVTQGILRLIRAADGVPISTQEIRQGFEEYGWIKTKSGQDRTQTIYETIHRLAKSGRIKRHGANGYTAAEDPE